MVTNKQLTIAASFGVLLKAACSQSATIGQSLRRIEANSGLEAPARPALKPDYEPSDESSWWVDWNDVKCAQTCEGPPPCGGNPAASWMKTYPSEEECCAAIFGPGGPPLGRCVARTLRAEMEHLIEESERELIPKFLRLGFHDCVGGCDGCVDLSNPDNRGLEEPVEALAGIADKFSKWYSRADIWAIATLVSADMSLVENRPEDVGFPMRYIGRRDCEGADEKGIGGPDVAMPSNDLTTHQLLEFFDDEFGFGADETVTIMGAHAVAVATRENVGFGNLGKEEGWVLEAEEYILDNRYYDMLLGDVDGLISTAPTWELELVHNEGVIPSRYQWFNEEEGQEERPIMTNADMALVRDLSGHMAADDAGNEGKVDCVFKENEEDDSGGGRRRLREDKPVVCPVAAQTIGKALEYKLDNELFLHDFERVLEKMVNNGYST